MKLFLTSTGLPKTTAPFFLSLLDKPSPEYLVSYIPTAGDPYTDKWFVNAGFEQLINLGFKVQTVDLKGNPSEIKQQLTKSQIIYPSGGNTFYLMDWVRKSNLDKYLKELLEEGRVYIGGSASSIIVGPDIALAGWSPDWDTNDVNLTDTSGLNLVPFVISPHFTESNRPILESHASKINYDIVPITDSQAIYWHDNQSEFVGGGEQIKLKL